MHESHLNVTSVLERIIECCIFERSSPELEVPELAGRRPGVVLGLVLVMALGRVLFCGCLGFVTASDVRVEDFGAKGDGKTLNTEAFSEAFEQSKKLGGGRVVVGSVQGRVSDVLRCQDWDLARPSMPCPWS